MKVVWTKILLTIFCEWQRKILNFHAKGIKKITDIKSTEKKQSFNSGFLPFYCTETVHFCTSPIWLNPIFVCANGTNWGCWTENREVFQVLRGVLRSDSARRKTECENKCMNKSHYSYNTFFQFTQRAMCCCVSGILAGNSVVKMRVQQSKYPFLDTVFISTYFTSDL